MVSDCGCELCRTTIGFADQRGDARISRAHVVEARLSTERTGLPAKEMEHCAPRTSAGGGWPRNSHDERRMNGAQFLIAEAGPRHHERTALISLLSLLAISAGIFLGAPRPPEVLVS